MTDIGVTSRDHTLLFFFGNAARQNLTLNSVYCGGFEVCCA